MIEPGCPELTLRRYLEKVCSKLRVRTRIEAVAVAVGAVGWYARRSYFVGVHQGNVTIFKGVPGGLAGWDPTIERIFPALAVAELRSADRQAGSGSAYVLGSDANRAGSGQGRDGQRRGDASDRGL